MSVKAVEDQDNNLEIMLAMRPVYAKNLEVIAFDPVVQTLDGNPVRADDYHSLGLIVSGSYGVIQSRQGELTVPCFLPVTAELLKELNLPIFPTDHYVFEVTPQVDDNQENLDRYRSLADEGYRVCVVVEEANPHRLVDYLDFAHILKVDASRLDREQARNFARESLQRGIDPMAINLASKQDLVDFIDMGYIGFAGDILGRPEPQANQKLGHNKVILFQLLAELQRSSAEISSLEQIILKDPNLTFKILKIVNSAAVGLAREIQSVSHAISILGMGQMQRWASVLLLEDSRGKPLELMREALVRARMCELLAEASSREQPMSYFMTGLLSNLDVITDVPMSQIITEVPLSEGIKKALVSREGDLGAVLHEVENYQQGIFPGESAIMNAAFYEPCYRHCTAWANKVQSAAL